MRLLPLSAASTVVFLAHRLSESARRLSAYSNGGSGSARLTERAENYYQSIPQVVGTNLRRYGTLAVAGVSVHLRDRRDAGGL